MYFLQAASNFVYDQFASYPPVHKASDLPRYCTRLAEILDRNPLLQASFPQISSHNRQALPLPYDDARISEIFTNNAREFDERRCAGWYITSFDHTDHSANLFRTQMNEGITLRPLHLPKCPINDLKASYDEVFFRLKTGWTKIQSDKDGFVLFKKPSTLHEEDSLIRFIITRFSLDANASCNKERIDDPTVYLSIRESAFDNVINTLGFDCSKNL